MSAQGTESAGSGPPGLRQVIDSQGNEDRDARRERAQQVVPENRPEHSAGDAEQDASNAPSGRGATVVPVAIPLTWQVQRPTAEWGFVERARRALDHALQAEPLDKAATEDARRALTEALVLHDMPRARRFFVRAAPLMYLIVIGITQIAFIEMYVLWHGASFISLSLFSPENISKLASISFVRIDSTVTPPSPTTMAVAAEVFMWSSLGVWAQRSFTMVARYAEQRPELFHDVSSYIGVMVRNTSTAAVVMILLKLADVQIFGVGLNRFDAVVGLSFIFGFFGDETFQLLNKLRERIFGQAGAAGEPGQAAPGRAATGSGRPT